MKNIYLALVVAALVVIVSITALSFALVGSVSMLNQYDHSQLHIIAAYLLPLIMAFVLYRSVNWIEGRITAG